MDLFTLHLPEKIKHPFILSFPHSGTYVPSIIAKRMKSNMLLDMDDTDWDLDKLYDFAFDLGIPVLKANYHRWVVDLNRDPSGVSLYNDGRKITGLVTEIDFLGEDIYRKGQKPDEAEIEERITMYFNPFHNQLAEIIEQVKTEFGLVFLWDAHSIRRHVPSIRPEPFPDMILGTHSGKSCPSELEQLIFDYFLEVGYQCQANTIFKGGYITRNYGNPANGTYTFQLEMSKDLYMKDFETQYDKSKASGLKLHLHSLILNIFEKLDNHE